MQKFRKQTHIIPAILFSFITLTCISHLPAQKKSNNKSGENKTGQHIILTSNGSSQYSIMIPAHATPHEIKAATVLQDYLLQISCVALPVITADRHRAPYEIILGQNERLDELSVRIDYNLLKQDGFVIRTDSLRLIIAGGNEKG